MLQPNEMKDEHAGSDEKVSNENQKNETQNATTNESSSMKRPIGNSAELTPLDVWTISTYTRVSRKQHLVQPMIRNDSVDI